MHEPSAPDAENVRVASFDPPDASQDATRTHAERSSLLRSFGFAFAGLFYVVRTQRNMRIHLAIGATVVTLGLLLRLEWTQWAVLGLTMGFVFVAEMFNTVAEAALDAATPYYHPLVQIAKDVAAGAVLLTSLISVMVGLLVLGPPLWMALRHLLSW